MTVSRTDEVSRSGFVRRTARGRHVGDPVPTPGRGPTGDAPTPTVGSDPQDTSTDVAVIPTDMAAIPTDIAVIDDGARRDGLDDRHDGDGPDGATGRRGGARHHGVDRPDAVCAAVDGRPAVVASEPAPIDVAAPVADLALVDGVAPVDVVAAAGELPLGAAPASRPAPPLGAPVARCLTARQRRARRLVAIGLALVVGGTVAAMLTARGPAAGPTQPILTGGAAIDPTVGGSGGVGPAGLSPAIEPPVPVSAGTLPGAASPAGATGSATP